MAQLVKNLCRWLLASSLSLLLFTAVSCEKSDSTDSTNINDNLPAVTGYPIVGTQQTNSYNNTTVISLPVSGADFFGQNSNHLGTSPNYVDNGDGTITDMVTGLMWTQSPDLNNDGIIDYDDKLSQAEAESRAATSTFAGHSDWRLPSIKELYSLVMFYGAEPSPTQTSQGTAIPYIDTDFFEFGYGDMDAGERIIDAQFEIGRAHV